MHYEINVSSLRRRSGETYSSYVHLFATHERSITTHSELKALFRLLKLAFPEPQFKLSVTRSETHGTEIDTATLA